MCRSTTSFELFTSEATQNAIQRIHNKHKLLLDLLKDAKLTHKVKALRLCGTIVAFNLHEEKNTYTYSKVPFLKRRFLDLGLLLRPLGNTLYVLPPYCITDEQLEQAYTGIIDVLEQI